MVPEPAASRVSALEACLERMRRAAARLEAEAAAGTLDQFWAGRVDDVRIGLARRLAAMERQRRSIAGEWTLD